MKIAEIAFKVKPGSQMYENFFIQEEEESKFLALAFRFIDKYFGKECDHSFKIAPQLSVSMSSEEHEKFKPGDGTRYCGRGGKSLSNRSQ